MTRLREVEIPQREQFLVEFERSGADDHSILMVRIGLAHMYRRANCMAEAISLYERTLADSERLLGTNHRTTEMLRENLAIARRPRPPEVGKT